MVEPCSFRQTRRNKRGLDVEECNIGANFRFVGPDMRLCHICPVPRLNLPRDCEYLVLYTRLLGKASHPYIEVTIACEPAGGDTAPVGQVRLQCDRCPLNNTDQDVLTVSFHPGAAR